MTILITGANRGIGAELLRQYAKAGETIIATLRGEIPADMASLAEWHQLDVTDQSSFDVLKQSLDGRSIDLLICNAGVYLDRHDQLNDGFTPDKWHDTFAANVTGPFLTVQHLLPNLQASSGTKIAIVASKMGSNALTTGGSYIYRSSKAAAINLASNLAYDLAPFGISIGAYHPGWVITDMGGQGADIDVATSAKGLIRCFAAQSLDDTGCFRAYDGTDLPF